ncbi:MAG: GNAT family N-acetyltransferase [Burkholderiales bacterium]|nr:GNAT family N-acetyltransferase [Burkholderiales bacterium]
MIIRKITAFERNAVRRFYLDLSSDDRRKRFCCMLSDEAISKYVDGVDFMRHTILGAFNEHAQLIGLAELAPGTEENELAFSVRPDLRSRGIGTRLMKRSLLYARICGMRKVFVMFLSDNTPMSRLAKNAGMQVKTAGSETYAARELAAPSAQELSSWFIEEAIAHGEYFSVLGIERWGSLVAPPGTPRPRDARDAVAV